MIYSVSNLCLLCVAVCLHHAVQPPAQLHVLPKVAVLKADTACAESRGCCMWPAVSKCHATSVIATMSHTASTESLLLFLQELDRQLLAAEKDRVMLTQQLVVEQQGLAEDAKKLEDTK